ncbi:angiomotin-like protein 2 [Chelonus insularis]|uniref:angiomotin-like protein 2 n=1 Tax=Chelonus insularis TaxID=460826 RepID=UPI00158C51F3|nr:angiomotin-like protein 2 [Chelonus insularis]
MDMNNNMSLQQQLEETIDIRDECLQMIDGLNNRINYLLEERSVLSGNINNLTRENQRLIAELESNVTLLRDVERLRNENKILKRNLQIITQKHEDLERVHVNDLDETLRIINDMQKEHEELSKQLKNKTEELEEKKLLEQENSRLLQHEISHLKNIIEQLMNQS